MTGRFGTYIGVLGLGTGVIFAALGEDPAVDARLIDGSALLTGPGIGLPVTNKAKRDSSYGG